MTVELPESRRLVTIFTALIAVLTVAVPIRAFGSLLEDPCVSLVADFRHEWQIVAAEARRILPFVAVLVEPSNGHVVAWTVLNDQSFNPTESPLSSVSTARRPTPGVAECVAFATRRMSTVVPADSGRAGL